MSLARSASARRPEPLPSYEQFAARRREEAGVLRRAPAWAGRQRRRYRRLVREYEASLERWRHVAGQAGEQWRFVCDEAERRVSGDEYRGIVDGQAGRPQLVLETLEGGRWWMYDGRFYASTAEAEADDVVAAARVRRRRPRRAAPPADTYDRPIHVADRRPPPTPGAPDLPAEVRRYVHVRDQGRCASCGDDGPELRVDPTLLRLICADCVADGWLPPAARSFPSPSAHVAGSPAADPTARNGAGGDRGGEANGARSPGPRRERQAAAAGGSPDGARPTRPRSRRRRSRRGR